MGMNVRKYSIFFFLDGRRTEKTCYLTHKIYYFYSKYYKYRIMLCFYYIYLFFKKQNHLHLNNLKNTCFLITKEKIKVFLYLFELIFLPNFIFSNSITIFVCAMIIELSVDVEVA